MRERDIYFTVSCPALYSNIPFIIETMGYHGVSAPEKASDCIFEKNTGEGEVPGKCIDGVATPDQFSRLIIKLADHPMLQDPNAFLLEMQEQTDLATLEPQRESFLLDGGRRLIEDPTTFQIQTKRK